MSPQQIQEALSRPPVFGDAQQITAIRAIQKVEEAKEGKNEYRVTVEYSFSETVTVWAEDEKEARALAYDSVDLDDVDIDYTVRKIEKK